MHILVLDDHEMNRKLIRACLEAEGFTVTTAEDGVEGLDTLEKQKFDAIISDILMPRMDGYAFCHEVRQSQSFHAIPFIFYTATYTSASDE